MPDITRRSLLAGTAAGAALVAARPAIANLPQVEPIIIDCSSQFYKNTI